MKEIKRKIEIIYYICEICDKEYKSQIASSHCELKHKREACDHSKAVYEISNDEGLLISEYCEECSNRKEYYLADETLDDYLSNENKKELFELFNSI